MGSTDRLPTTGGLSRRDVLIGSGIAASVAAGAPGVGARRQSGGEEQTWDRTFDGPGTNPTLLDVVAIGDGDVVGVGRATVEHEDVAWAVRLAPDGTVHWSDTYRPSADPGLAAFYGAAPAPDGRVYVAGTGASVDRDGDDRTAGWVALLGSDGALEWQTALAGPGPTRLHGVVRDDDGCVAAGEVDVENRSSDPFVVALDGEGDERWHRHVEEPDGNLAIRSIAGSSSGFCVVGDASERPDFSGRQGYALGLDGGGSVRWRDYVGDELDREFYDVVGLSSDGFVLAGSFEPEGVVSVDALLLGVDESGDVLWERTYRDGEGLNYLLSIDRVDDAVVATGVHPEEGVAWLIGAGVDGTEWFEDTVGALDQRLESRGVAVLADGNVVLAGAVGPYDGSSGYVLRRSLPAWESGDDGLLSDGSGASELPGFGIGTALAGLGGAALAARWRRSSGARSD